MRCRGKDLRMSASEKPGAAFPGTCAGNGAAHVRVILGMLTKLRALTGKSVLSFLVRALAILSTSYAAGLGFLAAIMSPEAHYDPHSFAIGSAALFGAACGAIGLLISRIRLIRAAVHDLRRHLEDLADRNWELKEAEERARSLLEAQGDLIVRRDGDNRITYANDAYCALGAHSRAELIGSAFTPAVLEQGET